VARKRGGRKRNKRGKQASEKKKERNGVRKRVGKVREDLLLSERISIGSCMSFFHGVEIYGLLKLLPRRKHICF